MSINNKFPVGSKEWIQEINNFCGAEIREKTEREQTELRECIAARQAEKEAQAAPVRADYPVGSKEWIDDLNNFIRTGKKG